MPCIGTAAPVPLSKLIRDSSSEAVPSDLQDPLWGRGGEVKEHAFLLVLSNILVHTLLEKALTPLGVPRKSTQDAETVFYYKE